MSKKIIYLLSLLMALSLVFAGCKKASTAPGGEGPTKEDEVKPPSNLGSTGLFDTQAKLDEYKEKPIQQSTEVAKYENGNYMRNPVITVVGGSTVVVFYEIRYQTAGAGNDVALTGENAVSIAYVQSKDSGISFSTTGMGEPKFVGGAASTGAADAHGAPIVFNTGKEIVVVASAGIGLSSGVYQAGIKESKLQYSVATINKSDNTVGEFGKWQDMQAPGDVVKNGYTQYGTHSARGTVADDGKTLLLPVTLADYTQNPSKFGYVLYTGTVTGNTVTWTPGTTVVDMPSSYGGIVKETRIPSGNNGSDYVYLAVSSDTGKITQGKADKSPQSTSIQGSDGSAGTLVVSNWYGTQGYDPKNYSTASGKSQSILSHVLENEKNLAIRLVDGNFANQTSGNFALGGAYEANAKSSSMDVLKDGTIVMIAEGGKVTDAATRPFYIYFSRFSQAYIANQTK